jgi:hypothetical protein
MAEHEERFEMEKWWVKWTAFDYIKLKILQTTWGKAVIGVLLSAISAVVTGFFHSPRLMAGSIGGVVISVGISLWSRLQSHLDSRLKPLVPDALKAIDQRIDIVWGKHFGSANLPEEIAHAIESFKDDLKIRVRLMLTSLDMVKTREEYALEEIAKITNDKDHPFNHPEDSFHDMALRRMIELKEMAYPNVSKIEI